MQYPCRVFLECALGTCDLQPTPTAEKGCPWTSRSILGRVCGVSEVLRCASVVPLETKYSTQPIKRKATAAGLDTQAAFYHCAALSCFRGRLRACAEQPKNAARGL